MAKKLVFKSDFDSEIYNDSPMEGTRKWIAYIFVTGYVLVILFLIVLTTFFHLMPDVAKDYLLAVGSPLGFIIGFYFKSQEQK